MSKKNSTGTKKSRKLNSEKLKNCKEKK